MEKLTNHVVHSPMGNDHKEEPESDTKSVPVLSFLYGTIEIESLFNFAVDNPAYEIIKAKSKSAFMFQK